MWGKLCSPKAWVWAREESQLSQQAAVRRLKLCLWQCLTHSAKENSAILCTEMLRPSPAVSKRCSKTWWWQLYIFWQNAALNKNATYLKINYLPGICLSNKIPGKKKRSGHKCTRFPSRLPPYLFVHIRIIQETVNLDLNQPQIPGHIQNDCECLKYVLKRVKKRVKKNP